MDSVEIYGRGGHSQITLNKVTREEGREFLPVT